MADPNYIQSETKVAVATMNQGTVEVIRGTEEASSSQALAHMAGELQAVVSKFCR